MVTVFLAACATKVALYVLIRFDYMLFQARFEEHQLQFALCAMPLAILGILVASAVAMFEGHLKRLLASSSIAQIGYILLGDSFITMAGLTASAVHLFNHALMKGGLFLGLLAPIRLPLDGEYLGVMDQAVDHRHHAARAGEDLRPCGE